MFARSVSNEYHREKKFLLKPRSNQILASGFGIQELEDARVYTCIYTDTCAQYQHR